MDGVILIDASQILTIMRRSGVDGLTALLGRGEYFFFSRDLQDELEAADEWETKNGERLRDWLDEQRVNGRLIELNARVPIEEYATYDLGKRGTSRGGKELSDMSIRRFMLQNRHRFTFELISRDLELLEHRVDDPKHTLHGLQFDRLSTRSALTWLATHPDVQLNPDRLRSLLKAIHEGKFDLSKERGIATHELERESFHLPETYEDALRERARRAETGPRRQSDMKGLGGQADARLGGAPVDPGAGVAMSVSDASLDDQVDSRAGGQTGGETGRRIDPDAALGGKASGSLREGPGIGRRFMNMMRKGAPVVLLGLAIPPVFTAVKAHAEKRNIPFDQAARELGLELGEEELKGLAAEAGLDLAVTFTPIGPLKKAWDVLGNVDDIVSLMQLYGAAYPENEMIRQMAALADEVAGSTALAAYVEGRDALTAAIGGAIDFVLGSAESEDEASVAISKVRSAIREGSKELGEAAANGARRDELTDLLLHRAKASDPAPLVAPDLPASEMSPGLFLEGEAPLSGAAQIPGSHPTLPPSFSPGLSGDDGSSGEGMVRAQGSGFSNEAPTGSEFIEKTGLSFSPGSRDAAEGAPGVDPYARKTSYDRNRKLGRTPEEEAEALAEFEDLLREAYVVTGNMPMAQGMASAQLKVEWGSSAFAAEEGTVMKYPVEKAYVDPEKDGHGYVRSGVERLLTSAGIRATRWYLEPNGKTAEDRFRGIMDADGYGPRMTLSYDDEAGTLAQLRRDVLAAKDALAKGGGLPNMNTTLTSAGSERGGKSCVL